MKTTRQKKEEFINAGIEIKDQLYQIFGKNDIFHIADIGACDGLSTIIYANMFPRAIFYVFEPVVSNYEEMMANFEEFGIRQRVVGAVNCALSDKEEKVKFYRSKGQAEWVHDWETGNKSSSIFKPKYHRKEHPWCEFYEEEVSCITLDSILTGDTGYMKNFVTTIDFAHIDVQGSELKVLKGGKKVFKNTKAIWLEVANIELYEGQPLKREISQYLARLGFHVVVDTCKKKTGDMLWVR